MKKGIRNCMVFIAVMALMAYTCPDKVEHQEKLNNAINSDNGRGISQNTFLDLMFNARGNIYLNMLTDQFLEVDKYLVISIGTLPDEDNNRRVVSIGLLNHVFIYKEDKTDQK